MESANPTPVYSLVVDRLEDMRRDGRVPDRIVVTPEQALAMAIELNIPGSVTEINGIPVVERN